MIRKILTVKKKYSNEKGVTLKKKETHNKEETWVSEKMDYCYNSYYIRTIET